MPSKDFIIKSRDEWRDKCLHAEGEWRTLHRSAQAMANFITKNCAIYEVSEERAIQETNFMVIDEKYYLCDPEEVKMLN
jgi:hypothetical protein